MLEFLAYEKPSGMILKMSEIFKKELALHAILKKLGSVLVAFSAGVDSSYLLAVAVKVLGAEKVRAVTSDSGSLPMKEKEEAAAFAQQLGVVHEFVQTGEFELEAYLQNTPERCFYCRDMLFQVLAPIAEKQGLRSIVYGATADDLGDYRPGMKAAEKYGVRAPLLEAGLTKTEIRELSKRMGLSTCEKPAMACLSSRIPYGSKLSIEKLSQVEAAEAFLKEELGIHEVRVRHHGTIARVEVAAQDMPRLLETENREELVRRLKVLGFSYVALDLAGFRSGSMNEVLVPRPD